MQIIALAQDFLDISKQIDKKMIDSSIEYEYEAIMMALVFLLVDNCDEFTKQKVINFI